MSDLVKKEDVVELLRENINASRKTDLLQVNNIRLVRSMSNYDLPNHDQQIRNEVIEEFRNYYQKRYEEEKKMALIFDFTLDILKEFEQMKGGTK